MRVLHLTRDFPPRSTGGISTAVGGLVAALAAAGAEQQVVSFDAWRPLAGAPGDASPSEERGGPVNVLRVSSPAAAEVALARAAVAQPDLVHVHDGLLWPWSERCAGRCPRLLTAHVLHHQLNRARGLVAPTLSSAAQDAALAAADAVVAPSQDALASLVAEWPDLAARTVSIGLGVSPVLAPVARRAPPVVLVVGRFADVKGTGEVVAAIPLLLTGSPEVEVVVLGGNPESPRSDRRWRQRLTAAGAVAPGRLHLPGWLEAEAVARWQDRAWVQLCPSWCESFGLAAAEAMARGVAVVATEVGALAELVGDDGRLVPARDPAALAAAALALVVAPATAAALGRSGHARVAARQRWEAVAAAHLALYRQLVAGR